MIRKAVIVVLTLGALALQPVAWMTCVQQLVWRKITPNSLWAVGVVGGFAFVVNVSSNNPGLVRHPAAYWKRREFGARFLRTHEAFDWTRRIDRRFAAPITYVEVFIPLALPFVLLAAYPTIALIRGPLRRSRRRKRGECVNCGYNLTGNVTGVCSECGTAV